jgi:hypothetical protein
MYPRGPPEMSIAVDVSATGAPLDNGGEPMICDASVSMKVPLSDSPSPLAARYGPFFGKQMPSINGPLSEPPLRAGSDGTARCLHTTIDGTLM